MGNHRTTDFDLARDELFSHIHRCGVMKATQEQQAEWMEDTKSYLAERHPSLSAEELQELREIGERFCRPAIPHGPDHTALNAGDGTAEEQEMAGAA